MSHLATIPPEAADGQLAQLYGEIRAALGRVPASFQLYSLSPELLEQQWRFIGYFWHHPTLSGPFLAFLRLCVSSEFHCDYCIGFNGAMLIHRFGWAPEQLAAARRDLRAAPLSPREAVLLDYCVEAVRSRGRLDAARLHAAREAGWSDREIFDAVHHAARNVAADILFNTFDLQPETLP